MTISGASAWRDFLRDAYREAGIALQRAERRVAAVARGTSERRRASREVRERFALRDTLRRALADVSMGPHA